MSRYFNRMTASTTVLVYHARRLYHGDGHDYSEEPLLTVPNEEEARRIIDHLSRTAMANQEDPFQYFQRPISHFENYGEYLKNEIEEQERRHWEDTNRKVVDLETQISRLQTELKEKKAEQEVCRVNRRKKTKKRVG